ncbi:MAG: class II aldolase/adducin family protein [Anaerolineales bacterium]|nr:class II aldolase/adducin family protein [Anaerolineales bacterium]
MSEEIRNLKHQIASYAKQMYDRHLTDAAGGNLSVRVGDVLYMTPRYGGSLFHWDLSPEQILTIDLDGNQLEGYGEVSREAKAHLKLLTEFYPDGTAVIHAHSRHTLVFCAAAKDMPSVLHCTAKFGTIPAIPDEKAHSKELADAVADGIRPQKDRIAKGAAAVMAPKHGLFLISKDLPTAFDSVERIDTNAYMILNSAALGGLL